MQTAGLIKEVFTNPKNINEIFSQYFEEKNHKFRPLEEIYETEKLTDRFEEPVLIGELELEDGYQLDFFTIKTKENLSERSSKRQQYEIAKDLLKLRNKDAGIFIFYDEEGNFRFSFVFAEYQGKKRDFSHYKRYTYFVSKDQPNRTFIERLDLAKFLSLDEIKEAFSVKQLTKEFYNEIQNWYAWALKEFQDKKGSFPGGRDEENLIRLITRLIFVWFLKEKKLIPEEIFDEKSLENIVKDFKKADNYYNAILQNLFFATLNRPPKDRDFAIEGNLPENRKHFGIKILYRYSSKLKISKEEFIKLLEKVPFINGGLFECLDKEKDNIYIYIDGFSRNEKKRAKLPDYLFFSDEKDVDLSFFYGENKKAKVKGIINILKEYNFTVDESSPIDIEVSLDPELLGHIFENLLASFNPETQTTARKATGSYYTPKEIVEFMVDEALTYYLVNKTGIPEEKIRELISYDENHSLTQEEREKVITAIDELKVIDPAVGSGAFPMGILHKLVHILHKTDPDNKMWKEKQISRLEKLKQDAYLIQDVKIREEILKDIENQKEELEKAFKNEIDYARKLFLIENSIYGVDIQPIAIQIAKLRFFLSLLIDQKVDKSRENYGILPLPNLETKFVSANTLIGLEKPDKFKTHSLFKTPKIKNLEEKYKELMKSYFSASNRSQKKRIQEKAEKIREELAKELKSIGFSDEATEKIAKFDIFDQLSSADWFDPEWMFGVEDGFDIVIGNPPYGVKVEKFNSQSQYYKFYDKQKNSASFFIEKASEIVKNKGIVAYIVPKSLTFSEGWYKTRELILNENTLKTIIDVSKAFERVRLEQVIIIYEKYKSEKDYKFLTGDNWISKIEIKGYSTKSLAQNLNTIPVYIDDEKLKILNKLLKDSIMLDSISETSRGLPFQRKISKNGNLYILRGKNIKKYAIYGELDKISLTTEELRKKKVKEILKPKIISQNIVAHVMNPYDRIIIMATLDKEGILTLDTVMNTFITNQNYSYQYILALLNSKLAEWYFYWFVFNRAIRTMHFDKYYMGKLPVKKITLDQQKPFIDLVDKILELTSKPDYETNPTLQQKVNEYSSQIDQLVYQLYNLTDEEIERIERKLKKETTNNIAQEL
ncbi:Eco57I restriction-modification methylase domain-containing protein [Sulfurihydrogenibium subterraneum]|uniref:Eco57I restriction-modification methylase domain-containing protein n=1 Tax=Sulfurihydrogenibium subterraneum TaxID=171121 RepID=UPI000684F7E1|nr:TaqI-like C-terminal specificity domain-containing protein [Sulfurihydrogenibium subterraneum]